MEGSFDMPHELAPTALTNRLVQKNGARRRRSRVAVFPGKSYQPKPTPTPAELSELLNAPPKVTVARSLIARW